MLFCLTSQKSLYAQKTDVAFKVVNQVDSLALEKASVILIRDRDSAFLGFGITDSTGSYTYNHLKLRSGTSFVISSLGFIPATIPVQPTDSGLIHRFVALVPDTGLLQDVIVQSAAAVRMKGDTLEYNTAFFKTMPNAVVEELLKKLPGIQFRGDDEIYADGQRVSKITVDGKDFFSSEPKVLLKNLPAELVSKVQVVDEKNTIATDIRQKEDIPKIINLRLKKDVRQGLLGKVFAGYGTDKRYETGGLLNLFRDTLQVSLIGTSNNQSSQGFSSSDLDEMGGFDRSGELGGLQSYDLNNNGSSGIPKKTLAGTNINYNFTNDIKLNLQYFYKQNSTHNEFQRINDLLFEDSTRHSISNGLSESASKGHQLHTGFSWKQDSTGYLNYNFDWSRNTNDRFNSSYAQTRTTHVNLFQTTSSLTNNHSSERDLSTDLSYSKTFPKAKIDISFNGNYENGLNTAQGYVDNITTQYIQGYIPDSILRHELSNLPSTSYNVGASIHKTFHKKHMVIGSAGYNKDLGRSGDDVYQRSSLVMPFEYTPGQSIKFKHDNGQLNALLSYRFHDAKSRFNFSVGGKYYRYDLINTYSDASIVRQIKHYDFFTPDIGLNYKSVGFSFSRSMQPPSPYFLSPITDSSSNLFYHTGNPALSPSTSSNLSLHFNKYWNKSQFSISSNLSQRWNQDNVIAKTVIDQQGISRSTYINYGSGNNSTFNINIDKGYHKKDFNMGTGLSLYALQNKTPLYLNSVITQTTTKNVFININANASYKELIQVDIGCRINFNNSSSEDATFKAISTQTFSTFLNLKWKPTHRLVFQWNNRYNTRSNQTPGQKTKWYFSDASLAYSFFKKENVECRLSGYDLFNQNDGYYQAIHQNQTFSSQDLVQKRYFMLTISYKFRKIGD